MLYLQPWHALAFPFQKISEGSRFGFTNVWKWNLPLAVLTNPRFRLLSLFERALMVKSLWPMPSTGRSCRRTPASHWMLDRIMLWQMMFRCVAQLVKTCWDAVNASELEVFQSDRPIFCVCSPCLSMLQIHLQPLKKSICHVPREPNITLLLVCFTLVYLVLIWTMAIIVSIATSDSPNPIVVLIVSAPAFTALFSVLFPSQLSLWVAIVLLARITVVFVVAVAKCRRC